MEYKTFLLKEISIYSKDRIDLENINEENYISTENLLPDKGGKISASSMPNVKTVPSYRSGDTLISNIRPYFRKIWSSDGTGGASNDVLIIRPNTERVVSKYLYYFLSQDEIFDYMVQTSKGTKMPRGDKSALMEISINLPSIEEQIKISCFLSDIDNKIELNKKMIVRLEQLAQTLFKRWFVDFEFPNENREPYKSSGGEMVESELGRIPGSWDMGKIGDLVKVRSGYAFKSAWWSNDGIPVIKIKDIDSGTITLKGLSHVPEEKYVLANDFEVFPGDLVIALTGATLGKVAIVPKTDNKMLVNQRVGKFFLGDQPLKRVPFIHSLITRDAIMKEIIDRGSGSAQANLSPSNLENIRISIPNKELLDTYNEILMPFYEQVVSIQHENSKLTNLRDTLLPRLLSGEIELPDETEVTENVPVS